MAEAPLSAEEIAHRGFPSSFRGFDPAEVRAYLVRVASELKAAAARELDLQKKVADAERRAANPVIDQTMLTRALGDETSRVLASAQQAAHDLKARAEESVAGILREAHEEALRIRAAAEVVLADRTEEADAAAGQVRAQAQTEAQAILEKARREAEALRNETAEQSRQLVQEAQAARARVLGDLTRRRRIAHVQVEQLRAGRERLLDAYRVVRRTLDEVADELERVEPEAREAATAAARRVEAALVEAGDPAVESASQTASETAAEDEVAGDSEDDASPLPGQDSAEPAAPATEPLVGTATLAAPKTASDAEAMSPMRRSSPAVVEPVVAREERVEERKLSSLRILRRPKPAAVSGIEALTPPSPIEGVRIIDSTIAGATTAHGDGEETPETRPPPPPERKTPSITPGVSWSPSPARPASPETVDELPVPDVPDELPVPAGPGPGSAVDDLFARLRAGAPPAGMARSGPPETPDPMPPPAPSPQVSEPALDVEPEPEPEPDADAESPDREAFLQRREESIEAIESGLARKLKRALQDEHNDVLDRLRSCREVPTTAAEFLPSPADQADRYTAAAAEFLAEAARCGIRFVVPNEPKLEASDPSEVADVVAELIEALVGPLRRAVERGVAGTPEDSAALMDCVGAAYRDCRSQRLEGIAGDATIAAFSVGTVSAASGAALRWVVDDGDRDCPDCDDNALAGPTPSGQRYPTGQAHPPAHAGCRCLLVTAAP